MEVLTHHPLSSAAAGVGRLLAMGLSLRVRKSSVIPEAASTNGRVPLRPRTGVHAVPRGVHDLGTGPRLSGVQPLEIGLADPAVEGATGVRERASMGLGGLEGVELLVVLLLLGGGPLGADVRA